ncbi:MAG: hypothetical protein LC754_12240 [Acidobacteria bacterium]|nr:hypothetical protein [Acidobacteriota bacterium]
MTQKLKVAIIQSSPVYMNLEASLDKAVGLIERAAAEDARLVTFGDQWYDLPGNNNERERQERLYVRDVHRIFAENKSKPKSKTPPTLRTATPQERASYHQIVQAWGHNPFGDATDEDSALGEPQNPYPGFSKGKLEDINKALADGAKLLQKSDCQKELAKAGINVTDLIKRFSNLSARPDSASNIKGYNVFYAEKSTDPQVQQFLKTERGKGAGAFIYGQDVMVRDAFFNARGGAAIGGEISRALALIHEAIHLTGKSDADFGGSSKLNDVVIHACWSKLYGHKNLAIVGN